MLAYFVGGQENGRQKQVPSDQQEINVAFLGSTARPQRYVRRMWSGDARGGEAFFVWDGLTTEDADAAIRQLIADT